MKHENQPVRRGGARNAGFLPTWFKLCAAVLVVLVTLKALQLQVFIEVSLDGIPYLAALTEVETYFIPLGLLLIYILASWIWNRFFGSRQSR